MRILIVRHGDPDYEHDSLTEKGFREAQLLSDRLVKENLTAAYVSPLGRAKRTAEPTLTRLGMTATELEWLREFPAPITEDWAYGPSKNRCPWNMPPAIWSKIPGIYDPEAWRQADMYSDGRVPERYDFVCRGWDELMASYGYTRDGAYYHAAPDAEEEPKTIALFCHLGLGNAILSHLMGASLPVVWHSLFLPTTSVTTVFMERHTMAPIALARLISVGDTSHLYAGGEPVSASGLHTRAIR